MEVVTFLDKYTIQPVAYNFLVEKYMCLYK